MNNDDILSLTRVMASIKRGLHFVAISVVCLFSFAILYVSLATPKYTAKTSILLDPAQAKTVADISSKARRGFENESIVSQLEIIKSRRVGERALQYLYSEQELAEINSDFVKKENTLSRLQSALQVYREGESYVLSIRYTAADPQMAADGANAFAQAYIYDQINSFSEGSMKTSHWLKNKIVTLRQQSVDAHSAIQEFRVRNNLINTGGRTVNEQQLSSINAKLGDAKAEVASASVKYKHSQEIIKKNDISAAVAEAFDNDVINNIRGEYIENQQRLLKLIRTVGAGHKAVKSLKLELKEAQNIIFSEMKRISQSYKNDYEVAVAKEESLEASLNQLIGLKVKNDSQRFELEALEREAESYKNLHGEYLEKFETINQQGSFPVSESRVISKAVAPLEKSHPKSILIYGMAIILGLGIGVFWALLVDNFDKSFKRAGQIESAAGLFFLGFFPKLDVHIYNKFSKNKEADVSIFANPEYRQSVEVPLSLHAETCRNVKVTIDKKSHEHDCMVIGVISETPNAGKSVTASNVALFIAQSGNKCLLIDADLRNPVLSQNNFSPSEKGLVNALGKKTLNKEIFLRDSQAGLYVLPADAHNYSIEPNLVNPANMIKLVESCKEAFDYIIIDLPPLSATSDASSFSVFIDCFLLVLEWGKSKPNSLNFHLKQNDIPKDKVLGVILSQADMKQMVQNYDHHIYPEYTKV